MIPDPNAIKSPVFHMQQFLRTIAQTHPEIPLVVPDGVYGPQTTQAVVAFQAMTGLPQTGQVDFATWSAIINTYDEVVAQVSPAKAIRSFPT